MLERFKPQRCDHSRSNAHRGRVPFLVQEVLLYILFFVDIVCNKYFTTITKQRIRSNYGAGRVALHHKYVLHAASMQHNILLAFGVGAVIYSIPHTKLIHKNDQRATLHITPLL